MFPAGQVRVSTAVEVSDPKPLAYQLKQNKKQQQPNNSHQTPHKR